MVTELRVENVLKKMEQISTYELCIYVFTVNINVPGKCLGIYKKKV